MAGTLAFLSLAAAAYLCNRILSLWKALRSINHLPGQKYLFGPYSLVAYVFPPIPFVSPGNNHHFEAKYAPFAEAGCDIVSIIDMVPTTTTTIMLADAQAIHEVTSSRARFPKPIDQYEVLSLYGRNIVASEGDQWKRFRKISAPAFSDDNNRIVWDEASRAMYDVFEEWKGLDQISYPHAADLTLPIALYVIAVVAFGKGIPWRNQAIPKGHRMTFRESLRIMCVDVWYKFLLPDWILQMNQQLRNVQTGFEELRLYMQELIDDRGSEKEIRDDIFSKLLIANATHEMESAPFDDQDLIANVYVMMLAGHETTAHTLCVAFALLALYPEEQDKLFHHVKSIMPDGQLPPYEEMSNFKYCLAVFYETMRLYPPTANIPKVSAEDTTLTTCTATGETLVIPVPKGTKIALSLAGLHYNPRYWKDPSAFKPSRFMEHGWNRDAFLPFSAGVRACIGRRFAETEFIAVLSLLISHYSISIMDDPCYAKETIDQRRERVLRTRNAITLTQSNPGAPHLYQAGLSAAWSPDFNIVSNSLGPGMARNYLLRVNYRLHFLFVAL